MSLAQGPLREWSALRVQANAQIYKKNEQYWDSALVGGSRHPLPFVDKVIYRIIKDEAISTALRTVSSTF